MKERDRINKNEFTSILTPPAFLHVDLHEVLVGAKVGVAVGQVQPAQL